MGERCVLVDHSTIYRWVQRCALEIDQRLRWRWRTPRSTSWRVDVQRPLNSGSPALCVLFRPRTRISDEGDGGFTSLVVFLVRRFLLSALTKMLELTCVLPAADHVSTAVEFQASVAE